MSRACFETPSDGLANVFQGLGLWASLGDAAWNGRALSNEHAGLVGFQRHEQLHTWILLHVASYYGVRDIKGGKIEHRYNSGRGSLWLPKPKPRMIGRHIVADPAVCHG
jgi:hypothetical protein